jgi:signal peptidase
LRSQRFDEPRLFAAQAGELSLSGEALLELMRAVLSRGVPFRFRARGWSMAPFIRDGDVITVTPVPHGLPRIGQVVAFVTPGEERLVVHRMVGRRGGALLIQGDSAPHGADGIIPGENILGRVTRVERNGRDVWLGLGPERIAIAWLSRTRWLVPVWMRLTSWRTLLGRR